MQVTILSFWNELYLNPLLPAGDHHDVLDKVGLELFLLLHTGDPHAVLGEFDSIFAFFCMQVSIMMFWIEFDLIFTFLFMQVITIVFCIVLDFISTFFCMQVITMVF